MPINGLKYDNAEVTLQVVRMAERSKALRSGRSPLLWAWVRIPLLTNFFFFLNLYNTFYIQQQL